MLPGEVPSDINLEEASQGELAGRWSLLVDLQSEFQGAGGAYLLFALIVPVALIASVMFEWVDQPAITLGIAALVFCVCLTLSVYSFIWCRWAKKREEKAYRLMRSAGNGEE